MQVAVFASALAVAIPVCAQSGGYAEFATQGYYLRNGSQNLIGTSGALVRFQEFVPNVGLFRGNLEAYRSEGAIQPADNFLELRGLVVGGVRWNLGGGDVRQRGSLLQNPFTNLYFPELMFRGAHVEASDSKNGFSLFFGRETLMAGPRIPFRINAPQ